MRIVTLIPSSSSARPSARRPWSAEEKPRPVTIAGNQARCDRSQVNLAAGGTTEGQALLQHPDGVLQVPLSDIEEAEAAVGHERCLPSAF